MSEEKKVKFTSVHANMSIMRKPQQTTRSVNGVMQIVTEDRPPFKFDNGELSVTEEEAAEIRKKRGFGRLYNEVPKSVVNVANKKPKAKKSDEGNEDPEVKKVDDNIKSTVVEEVTDFNSAMSYLKEEFGLEHKDVNSKDKVFAQAEKLKLEFPNYKVEET